MKILFKLERNIPNKNNIFLVTERFKYQLTCYTYLKQYCLGGDNLDKKGCREEKETKKTFDISKLG